MCLSRPMWSSHHFETATLRTQSNINFWIIENKVVLVISCKRNNSTVVFLIRSTNDKKCSEMFLHATIATAMTVAARISDFDLSNRFAIRMDCSILIGYCLYTNSLTLKSHRFHDFIRSYSVFALILIRRKCVRWEVDLATLNFAFVNYAFW